MNWEKRDARQGWRGRAKQGQLATVVSDFDHQCQWLPDRTRGFGAMVGQSIREVGQAKVRRRDPWESNEPLTAVHGGRQSIRRGRIQSVGASQL